MFSSKIPVKEDPQCEPNVQKKKIEIASTVQELNSVSSLCGLPVTSAEDILAGDFPWSFSDSTSTSQSMLQTVTNKFILII